MTVIRSEKEISLESSSSCGMDRTRWGQQEMHEGGGSPAKGRGMYRDRESPPGRQGLCSKVAVGVFTK